MTRPHDLCAIILRREPRRNPRGLGQGHPRQSWEALPGPPDGNPLHAQGGLADSDRNALAVLATGADAGIELEVIADHGDTVEVGRAVPDQHGALEGLRKLAVLDLVSLGHLEHVLARGDIDL